MKRKMKWTAALLSAALICASPMQTPAAEQAAEETPAEETAADAAANALEQIDMSAWQYNADDDVYYQTGIAYCSNPADEAYERLAVFVPGAYMTGTENGDGTWACELSADGEAGGYTAETAPIVMPINTPGYSAQSALTDYTDVTSYTDAGFVYVHAGCRGRDSGAPAGVTDLKAAIRYIRWCDGLIAGDAERIFTVGMSGGGAQSAIVGASGDSALYDPYLEAIGAVTGVSDAVCGSMCWCPITNLDSADEAYEWMMGSTRSGLSGDEQAISDALAEAYADYINAAGIQDAEGNVLTLEASEDGIYQAGSYYEYLKGVIEESLNHFLADTEFPYDASSSGGMGGMGGMGGPGGQGGMGRGGFGGGRGGHDGSMPPEMAEGGFPGGDGSMSEMAEGGFPGGDGSMPEMVEGGFPGGDGGAESGSGAETSFEEMDDISRNETQGGLSLSGTYETAEDYIAALNENGEWVAYDAETGTASITSIADFAAALKQASKNLGAFDQLDGGQGENELFGYGDGSGAHFDAVLAGILEELGSEYAAAYAEDLEKTDSVGSTVDTRLDMYTPLYYLLASEEGYGTASPAQYWRIRTGINQGDTSFSTEVNLALALENYEGVEDVDFETVWGQGHTMAERTGSSEENFIEWVNECMADAVQR